MGYDSYTIYTAVGLGVEVDFASTRALRDAVLLLQGRERERSCTIYKVRSRQEDYDESPLPPMYILLSEASILEGPELSLPGPYNIGREGNLAVATLYDTVVTEETVSVLRDAFLLIKGDEEMPGCKFIMMTATDRDNLEPFDSPIHPWDELVIDEE